MGGAFRHRGRDCLRKVGVLLLREHVDRDLLEDDASVGPNHEEISSVEISARGTIKFADLLTRVAAEEDGEARFACPVREHRIWIDAHTEDDNLLSVVEERGVLITVRLHLDRSAFRPRLEEEREHYSLTPIVREANRVAQNAESSSACDREVRRHGADFRSGGSGGLSGLLRGERRRDAEYEQQSAQDGSCPLAH